MRVPGYAPFALAVAANYLRHRLGMETACQWARTHLPRRAVLLGWAALTAWLLPHVIRGYTPKESL